jgi:AraC-like DNA-binding protein
VLCEGSYTRGMVNIGFVLNPDKRAMIQGYVYDDGTLAIDHGDASMHEVFPAHMVWVGITACDCLLKEALRLPETSHLALKGSRKELDPLLALVNRCRNHEAPFAKAEAGVISARMMDAMRLVISGRLGTIPDKELFPTGDKFRMHIVKCCHQLEKKTKGLSLGLDEICAAAGMKPRTLQLYFTELYGMGPTEYFRIRRLNQVRTALIQAGSGTTTVGAVAEQWGFAHMGRFSQRYKDMFAEYPSETLAGEPSCLTT